MSRVHRGRTAAVVALAVLLATSSCTAPGRAEVDVSAPATTSGGAPSSPAAGPNRRSWTVQTGDGGWGNQELQTYTSDAVRFGLEGSITITADLRARTSGRITSAGSWSFSKGALTARIRLPDGQGLLPAFWLLGDDLDSVGWPGCGEIDVVETPNTTTASVHSIHGPLASDSRRSWQLSRTVDHTPALSGGSHDFSVVRDTGRIVLAVDGRTVLDVRRDQVDNSDRWVFDQPFHVLFSLAIGGNWPGPPDASSPASATMVVESLRYDADARP